MTQTPFLLTLFFLLLALWFAWRYFQLRRDIAHTVRSLRDTKISFPQSDRIDKLVSAIESRRAFFESELNSLRKENERLATVLEQLTDGVLIADSDGRVQFANPAAGKLFETSFPAQQSVAQVVRSHQVIDAWKRCQQTRLLQIETVEIPIRKQYLQIIVIPDEHEGGSLILAQDLTRIRKLENVRRDFISNVSHELRTPLASLKALTETLQNGALSDPEAGPRFLERIHTEIDALTQMAQELLDLSRIESGQVQLNFESVSPRTLIDSAAERMKAQMERANLNLDVECETGLPNIDADKSRLEQVLVNLIHNSVKFTKPGGRITLGVEPISGGVRFAVRDTGIGIPSESLSRIFERFYRVDSSRTGSGTGLGLSISKHIVEAHGGKIWAESDGARGSTILFEIPCK